MSLTLFETLGSVSDRQKELPSSSTRFSSHYYREPRLSTLET